MAAWTLVRRQCRTAVSELGVYPDDRKIWNLCTRASSPTFRETVNDKFNRVGEITRDNSGASGNTLAKYYFNGMGRMVRREHDEATGAYGNDTRVGLYHDEQEIVDP